MEGGGRRGLDTGKGGMDDGSRAAMKDGGRDVTDVRSPGTSDNAVTVVRPSPLPLLLTQIILQGKRIDYSPSESVIFPPTPSIYLSLHAGNKFSYEAFKCQVVPQLTVSSMTRPGHCRITREKKKHPSVIYGAC